MTVESVPCGSFGVKSYTADVRYQDSRREETGAAEGVVLSPGTSSPVPVPFEEWLSAMVGVPAVFQQMPRSVTSVPPSFMTSPPPIAVVCVISVTSIVITEGTEIAPNTKLTGSGFMDWYINPLPGISC